jgi:hypothetical protein
MDDIDGRGRSGPIVGVLRAARNAGFAVDVDGEKLRVTGPQARSDILDEIREHKAEIIEAITHPPAGVSHYTERMTSGVEWLAVCWDKLLGGANTEAMADAFAVNLERWYNLDVELRRVYPEYRGCPVGGCRDEAIVSCMHCAALAQARTQP